MSIVMVNALKLDTYTVDKKLAVFGDALSTHTDLKRDILARFFNNYGIEIRILCIPKDRLKGVCYVIVSVIYAEGIIAAYVLIVVVNRKKS